MVPVSKRSSQHGNITVRLILILMSISILTVGCEGEALVSADCRWQDRDAGEMSCSFTNSGNAEGSACWIISLRRTQADKYYYFNEEGREAVSWSKIFPDLGDSAAVEAVPNIPPIVTSNFCSGLVAPSDVRDRALNLEFKNSSQARRWLPWDYCAIDGWHYDRVGKWGCEEQLLRGS